MYFAFLQTHLTLLGGLLKMKIERELKAERPTWEEMSFWQLVFSQSRVNGGLYEGENLTHSRWRWPTNTYLQQRRNYLRSSQPSEEITEQIDGGFYQPIGETNVASRNN
jgi:hypothetical protein